MNNLEYLNQISKNSRPVKTQTAKKNDLGLIFKILGIGVGIFILLFIFGALLGNKSSNNTDLVKQISLRTTNLNKTVTEYNKSLKSSGLLAISLSLSNTLTGAESQLKNYSGGQDGDKKKEDKSNLAASETAYMADVNNNLQKAKMNGILDRIYANEMQLQTSLLMSLIVQSKQHNKDPQLNEIYDQYYANLSTVEHDLENYANPSD